MALSINQSIHGSKALSINQSIDPISNQSINQLKKVKSINQSNNQWKNGASGKEWVDKTNLQWRVPHTITGYFQKAHICVQSFEKCGETVRFVGGRRQNVCQLRADILHQKCFRHIGLDEAAHFLLVGAGAGFDQCQVVAVAETRLEEDRGTAADQLPVGDDGDPIAQRVGLPMEVRAHDRGSVLSEMDQKIPNAAPCPWIHARRRFVQQNLQIHHQSQKESQRGCPKMTSASDIRSPDPSPPPTCQSLDQNGPIHQALSPAHRYQGVNFSPSPPLPWLMSFLDDPCDFGKKTWKNELYQTSNGRKKLKTKWEWLELEEKSFEFLKGRKIYHFSAANVGNRHWKLPLHAPGQIFRHFMALIRQTHVLDHGVDFLLDGRLAGDFEAGVKAEMLFHCQFIP